MPDDPDSISMLIAVRSKALGSAHFLSRVARADNVIERARIPSGRKEVRLKWISPSSASAAPGWEQVTLGAVAFGILHYAQTKVGL